MFIGLFIGVSVRKAQVVTAGALALVVEAPSGFTFAADSIGTSVLITTAAIGYPKHECIKKTARKVELGLAEPLEPNTYLFSLAGQLGVPKEGPFFSTKFRRKLPAFFWGFVKFRVEKVVFFGVRQRPYLCGTRRSQWTDSKKVAFFGTRTILYSLCKRSSYYSHSMLFGEATNEG